MNEKNTSSSNLPSFRCNKENCRKRIGFMSFTCSCCKNNYCVKHRMPEEHDCEGDFKLEAQLVHKKKILSEALPESHHYVRTA